MWKLLLVEDEYDLGKLLSAYLGQNNFKVTWCLNGVEALARVKHDRPDLAILDVMLPGMDGFEVGEILCSDFPQLPFLYLTARTDRQDRLKGLKTKAVDYMAKPFDPEELVLKIKNLLDRFADSSQQIKATPELLNPKELTLTLKEEVHNLTEQEYLLVDYLFSRPNELIRRQELLRAVWGTDDYFKGRSMDVFLSRIRKMLAADSRFSLENRRGIGYILRCTEVI